VFGLAAAKQFHVLNPKCSLAVFESDATLGGTWASSRLYTGLKSNNLLGTYEYPDFPMDPKVFNVQQRKHVPGQVIHDYLEAYARNFGIFPLIRFNSKVTVAEHQESGATVGWELTVMNSSTGRESTLYARRLIVANGVTSEPRPLFFKGQESFGRPIFHGKEFRQYATTIDTSKVVTVVGGSKYAWDAVYAYVTAGVRVNWVIRGMWYPSNRAELLMNVVD
jgi:cation diffusion facilitator CzcD-associated flavoprotein CzcO